MSRCKLDKEEEEEEENTLMPEQLDTEKIISAISHELNQLGRRNNDHLNFGQRYFDRIAQEVSEVLSTGSGSEYEYVKVQLDKQGRPWNQSQLDVVDIVARHLNPRLSKEETNEHGDKYATYETDLPGVIVRTTTGSPDYDGSTKTSYRLIKS